jgi:hypothetical protein
VKEHTLRSHRDWEKYSSNRLRSPKHHLDVASRAVSYRDNSCRRPNAWSLPLPLRQRYAAAPLQLIAACLREPSLFPLETECSICRTHGERSTFATPCCANEAVCDLLAYADQDNALLLWREPARAHFHAGLKHLRNSTGRAELAALREGGTVTGELAYRAAACFQKQAVA